jgi:hypothetical protein
LSDTARRPGRPDPTPTRRRRGSNVAAAAIRAIGIGFFVVVDGETSSTRPVYIYSAVVVRDAAAWEESTYWGACVGVWFNMCETRGTVYLSRTWSDPTVRMGLASGGDVLQCAGLPKTSGSVSI